MTDSGFGRFVASPKEATPWGSEPREAQQEQKQEAAAETHPEEQVEEEEQILDAVVDRHRGSVVCQRPGRKSDAQTPPACFTCFSPAASDWPTCSLRAEPLRGEGHYCLFLVCSE